MDTNKWTKDEKKINPKMDTNKWTKNECIICHTPFNNEQTEIENNNKITYSINMIGWGLVTDIGNKAEKYRWLLGTTRYTILSIIEVFIHKSRPATLIMEKETIKDDFTFIIACNSASSFADSSVTKFAGDSFVFNVIDPIIIEIIPITIASIISFKQLLT